jgi:hypothetical protein
MRCRARCRWRLAKTLIVLSCLSVLLSADVVVGVARASVEGLNDGRPQVSSRCMSTELGYQKKRAYAHPMYLPAFKRLVLLCRTRRSQQSPTDLTELAAFLAFCDSAACQAHQEALELLRKLQPIDSEPSRSISGPKLTGSSSRRDFEGVYENGQDVSFISFVSEPPDLLARRQQ